jgi:malonyl-CoA O-methyltransferase
MPYLAPCDDLYAEWAPHYAPAAHNPLMEVEQRAVMALLPSPGGQAVLDAGCGTGRYARLLMQAGARSVIGIDRSAAMLTRACQCGASYVRADIRALPVNDASADVIVSGLMLPDLAELERVWSEWHRALAPGGVLVCSTLHPIGAELGWTRTFQTPHGTRSIPAHWHTVDAHRRACRAAGLVLEAVAEPTLPPAGRLMRSTPKPVPVALVVRARRPRQP